MPLFDDFLALFLVVVVVLQTLLNGARVVVTDVFLVAQVLAFSGRFPHIANVSDMDLTGEGWEKRRRENGSLFSVFCTEFELLL